MVGRLGKPRREDDADSLASFASGPGSVRPMIKHTWTGNPQVGWLAARPAPRTSRSCCSAAQHEPPPPPLLLHGRALRRSTMTPTSVWRRSTGQPSRSRQPTSSRSSSERAGGPLAALSAARTHAAAADQAQTLLLPAAGWQHSSHAQRRPPSARSCAATRAPRAAPRSSCWTRSAQCSSCRRRTASWPASWPGMYAPPAALCCHTSSSKQQRPLRARTHVLTCTCAHALCMHMPANNMQGAQARKRLSPRRRAAQGAARRGAA